MAALVRKKNDVRSITAATSRDRQEWLGNQDNCIHWKNVRMTAQPGDPLGHLALRGTRNLSKSVKRPRKAGQKSKTPEECVRMDSNRPTWVLTQSALPFWPRSRGLHGLIDPIWVYAHIQDLNTKFAGRQSMNLRIDSKWRGRGESEGRGNQGAGPDLFTRGPVRKLTMVIQLCGSERMLGTNNGLGGEVRNPWKEVA
jgi:hypothetical protein